MIRTASSQCEKNDVLKFNETLSRNIIILNTTISDFGLWYQFPTWHHIVRNPSLASFRNLVKWFSVGIGKYLIL